MWFYAKDGEQHGPVEADDIRTRLKNGDLSNTTLVWKEGMAQWTPLGEVLELRDPVPGNDDSEQATTASDPYQAPAATQMPQPDPNLVVPMQQNTMALVSMILGILSICCLGALTGIPAIICGHIARKQFRESPTPQTGDGMALAGLILGYVTTILTIAYVVFLFVVVFGAATAASSVPAPAP